MKLQIKPDELRPGDVFVAPSGPYKGRTAEVVDVLRGKFATYRIISRLTQPVEIGLDYNAVVSIERVLENTDKRTGS